MALTSAERQRSHRRRVKEREAEERRVRSKMPRKLTRVLKREPLGSNLKEVEANILRIRRRLELVENDPQVPLRDKVFLAQNLTTSLWLRSKMLGEGELTDATVARSAPWRRMLRVIVEALRPWPAAVRSVNEALARITGDA